MTSKCIVTAAAAALELGVNEGTVRRWIREGAPCERLGGRGPGRGSLVVVDDLKRWRAGRAGLIVGESAGPDLSVIVARGLLRAFKRGTKGTTEPTWVKLGDNGSRAAIILADAYTAIFFELTGREPELESLPPPEIQFLHERAYSLLLQRTSSRQEK